MTPEEKAETIIVLDNMMYPKDFENRLNSFNKESNPLDFFLEDYAYVVGGMTRNKKRIEDIIEDMKEKLFESFQGKSLFIDGGELTNKILEIKDRTNKGMPLRRWLPWFFSFSIQIKGAPLNEDGEVSKEKLPNYLTITYEYKYQKNKKSYKFFIIFVNDGTLLKEPYISELEKWCITLFDKKVKNKLNNKRNKKRNPIDSRLRHECFKRDGYKCIECGITNKEKTLHADHILPVSQGGSDELENLQTLCESCNLAKSNKKWEGKAL